jgi:putative oxidoreductase
MTLTKRVGRCLVAAPVVVTSIETLRDPAARVKLSEPAAELVLQRLPDAVRGVPGFRDATEIVKTAAIAEAGAGLLLSTRRWRRLGALGLLGTLGPRAFFFYPFWKEQDPDRRAGQQANFLADLGLLGGLLLVAFDHEHERPVARARARRRARRSVRRAALTVGAQQGIHRARAHPRAVSHRARGVGNKVGDRAVDVAHGGSAAIELGSRAASKGAHAAREAQELGSHALGEAVARAQETVTRARS